MAASNGGLEVVRHLCVAGANTEAINNVSHGTYPLAFHKARLLHELPNSLVNLRYKVFKSRSKKADGNSDI